MTAPFFQNAPVDHQVGDPVTYFGALGWFDGVVAEVRHLTDEAGAELTAFVVHLKGVGRLLTSGDALTAATDNEGLVHGVVVHMDGERGPATNIETGVTTPAGEPLPVMPAQPGSLPIPPVDEGQDDAPTA